MVELPPVIELLSTQIFKVSGESVDDLFKSVRELIPELRWQAEWSVENHEYIDEKNKQIITKFAISPESGINPFSYMGKCSDIECRIDAARNFSSTLGLYSDIIYLTDPFTTQFVYDDGEVEWEDSEINGLLVQIAILNELLPLIKKGVIQFISPIKAICKPCFERFEEQVCDFSDQFVSEFWEQVEVEIQNDFFAVHTGNLHEPSMVYRRLYDPTLNNKKQIKKAARELFYGVISEEVDSHLYSMYNASSLSSTIFSNSRAGLMSLKKLEGHKQNVSQQIAWEQSRTAELPWLKNLTPTQIVELRDSASKSLPQFRELMHQNIALSTQEGLIDNNARCTELISELRLQAEEVKSELAAINIANEQRFHNTLGFSGISIALYSSAIGSPLVGLSALIATMGLIHTSLRNDHKEVEKLTSKPGYVLVKAEQILSTHN